MLGSSGKVGIGQPAGPGGASAVDVTAVSRLAVQYGIDPATGLPNRPWQPEPTAGANLWATANFSSNLNGADPGAVSNTASLTPSVAGGASAKATLTRITIPTAGNGPHYRWRFQATVQTTSPPVSGKLRLRIRPVTNAGAVVPFQDASGNAFAATKEYAFDSTDIANPYQLNFEIDVASAWTGVTPVFLDVSLVADAGTTGSTLALSNVTVYRVDAPSPPMRVAWDRATGGHSSGANLYLDTIAGYDGAGNLIRSRITFSPDGALELSFQGFQTQYEAAYANQLTQQGTLLGSYPSGALGENNSDMVITVYLADNVTTELRGNTHGGEVGASGTFTTDYQVFLDFGAGWVGPYLAQNASEFWQNCYRAKIVASTHMTRSDQGSPFATLAKTFYVYRDGTVRYDRTMTFLQDQKIDRLIWHMMSFDPTTGLDPYKGKIGQGLHVLHAMDRNAYMPVPALTGVPTVSAGTGGQIPANTVNVYYSVRVTALDALGGETTGSIASTRVHCPSANNKLTAAWSAVSGAAGYAVYFGLPGFERRVATVTATSYTITGTEALGQSLPQTNTAATTTQNSFTSSGLADWAIYYDTGSGAAVSMALDRAAVAAMPGVAGFRVDLQSQDASLVKNYYQLIFTGNDLPVTVTNGTVFAGTVWNFCYVPTDPVNFERDQASRSGSVGQLSSTLYPSV